MKRPTVLCAGEMLWDLLPAGEFIGGAPFNVACHAARLGARALLAARWQVFDPNLRAPHIDRDYCAAGLAGAGLVKVNEEECRMLAGRFGGEATPEALWTTLAGLYRIQALCVTLGAAGSRLHWQGQWHAQSAVATTVADTVGAGDSFLAMLVCELLAGSDAPTSLQRAAHLASYVASQSGAVADYETARFRGDPVPP